jgi:hypothetical protein
MQLKSMLLVPVLLGALLSACGEKPAEPVPEAAPVPAAAPAPAPTVVQVGGYEPTAEERVPGITRTKEEQDKINADALAGTPMPMIPGEAPPAAAENPAEAAPEAK